MENLRLTSSPATTPVETPVRTPSVEPSPSIWPERYTDPIHICPQQKRELTSPDVEP